MEKQQRTSIIKRYFVPYLMQYKWRIVFVAFLLIGAKVAGVLAPVYLKNVVDYLQRSITEVPVIETLFFLVGVYFTVRLLSVVLAELKDFLFSKVEARITRDASRDVFAHLMRLSLQFHLMKKTGSVATQIQRGISGIEFIFRFSLFNVVPTIIEFIFILGILLYFYHWSFAVVTLATVVVYMAYTIWIVERRNHINRKLNQLRNVANGHSIDSLVNIETVQYFTNEEHEVEMYDKKLAEVEDTMLASKNYLYLTNLGQGVIISLGMTALLTMASLQVLDSTMTIGDFTLVTVFMAQVSIPLSFIGFVYRQIKDSLINMEDMFALMDVTQDVQDKEGAVVKESFKKDITFDKVGFHYDSNREVLKDLSLKVNKGEMVALVGPSGSGKSTISKLLLRFYDIQEGDIAFDGVSLTSMTLDSLRKLIGVVPQEPVLFNDTIRYNISYGKPDATEAEIIEAAKKAHIHNLIASLPEGYDTIVGERGLRLSGGEKQRVAIARVILEGAPILLFDEATSSLDSSSEAIIQQSIDELANEKTLIVIAHRLSTIVGANTIFVLENGVLKEQGTHKELLETKGVYQRLWELQQKEESAA